MLRRRAAVLIATTCVSMLVLGACSGSGSSGNGGTSIAAGSDTAATTVPAPAAATGTGTPNVSPNTAPGATTVDTIQSGVTGTIIDTPADIVPTTAPTTSPLANDYEPAPADVSTVLQAVVPSVTIFDGATSNKTEMTLQNPLPSGAPLTFLVDGQTSTRFKVLLPVRPNGATGWVDPGQVKKFQHGYKVVVELSAHRITAYNGKDVVLAEKIATGKNDTPTPNGRYYIKELLKPCYDVKQADGSQKCTPNDKGLYGPYAYGLSGFSPVLTDFNGGTGVLGIHGTDQPQLLGTDVSHGCIRMSNSGITLLSKVLPLGTPVIVRP